MHKPTQFLLLATALTVLTTTLPSAAQPLTPKQFGIHLRMDNRPLPNNWPSLAKQTGAQVVRVPVPWGWFELEGKGQTPAWFWPQVDGYINAAKNNGQKVLITFFTTPCWATAYAGKNCSTANLNAGNWQFNMPPANPKDYADALKRLVLRYNTGAWAGTVTAYEIWNEPNIISFWANSKRRTIPFEYNDGYPFMVDRASIHAYTKLVVAGYQAVKSVNPSLKVIAGSIAGSDTYFLDEMYKAGAKGYFDAVSFHPYPDVIQAELHPNYGRAAGVHDCIETSAIPQQGCFKKAVEAMRSRVLAHGDNKPFWFSEFGVSSTPDWGGAGLLKGSITAAEQAQATEATKMVQLIKGWDFVETAIWYEFINRPKDAAYASSPWLQLEPYFGLYREDSTAKPVLASYNSSTKALPVPVQLAPVGTINNQNYPAEFSWQAVPEATGYVVWLNYLTNPPQNGKVNRYITPAQAGCATGYVCKITDSTVFANNITARWWVKAFFNNGTNRDSQSADFVLKPPTYPTLISPKQNVEVQTTSTQNAPAFVWKPFPGATRYRLWIRGYYPFGVDHADQTGDETIFFQTLIASQIACNANTCQYLPNLALSYSPSKWSVTAILANGQEYPSPIQGFTLYPSKTLLVKPGQIEPEGKGVSQRPLYAWTAITGAKQYRLWVNGSAGAGVIQDIVPASACRNGECRYTPTKATGAGYAEWWVTAIATAGQEATSDGMSFSAQ